MKDLREYAKQTNVRLALGAFILLFVVGVGLIWLIYGENAAGLGFDMFACGSFSGHSDSLCVSWHRMDPQTCPT